MKITKRQLKRIIREEKAKILRMTESYGAPVSPPTPAAAGKFAGQMGDATAGAVQLLQTVYYNLDDVSTGVEPDIVAELEMQMELIKDAIHALGAVLP